MTQRLEKLEGGVSKAELREMGLTVTNLVATLDLGRELDLRELSNSIEAAEYLPEQSPFLLYRSVESDSLTVLVPTNGQISVVGARTEQELYDITDEFSQSLEELGIEIECRPEELVVRNVVANGDFGMELELNALALALGFESTEYEPEQFPGLIYRGRQNATVLIFRSGKFVITGVISFAEVVQAKEEILSHMIHLDIELDS